MSAFLLDCASGVSKQRLARLDADSAIAVLSPINQLYRVGCPVWNIDLGEEFRRNFDTQIPTLLVHGTWNVSTPVENSLELAPHFTNRKLVPANGGSRMARREAASASQSFRSGLANFFRTGDFSKIPNKVNLSPINWVIPR